MRLRFNINFNVESDVVASIESIVYAWSLLFKFCLAALFLPDLGVGYRSNRIARRTLRGKKECLSLLSRIQPHQLFPQLEPHFVSFDVTPARRFFLLN